MNTVQGINTVLASCLINAKPLPAHRPAAAQGHDLADDWSLTSAHFVADARLGAFFY